MVSTTVNEHTKPMVNIVKLRDRIKQLAPDMRPVDAEAIAVAIDESLQQQDTTGFATKGDLNLAVSELNRKIDLIAEQVKTMPDKLFNRVLFAGGTIAAAYKLVEIIINVVGK